MALIVASFTIPSRAQAATAALSHKAATMEIWSTLPISVTNLAYGTSVTWSSSNSKIATVTKNASDQGAKVYVKSPGPATITANAGGTKYTCKITVVDANKGVAQKNTISRSSATLEKKSALQLSIVGIAKDSVATWKTSNASVVSVGARGKITAKKAGTATITATVSTTTNGSKTSKTYTCSVKVVDSNAVPSTPTPRPTATPKPTAKPTPTPSVPSTGKIGLGIGDTAPDITLDLKGGGTVTLYELRDKPVILNAWASWCGPCRTEMPGLQQIYDSYKNKIHMVGVAVWDAKSDTDRFINNSTYTYPIAYDLKDNFANLYKMDFIPQTWIIDERGVIVEYLAGSYGANTYNAISPMIDKIVR
jgi:peroxiredoxin